MRPILKYYNESAEAPVTAFNWGTSQPLNNSFSRGVKWESPQKREVAFFQREVVISACPCIDQPYFVLVYRGFDSYEPEKNFGIIVDYEGVIVKRLEVPPPASELAQNLVNKIRTSRLSGAFWQDVNGKIVACTNIDMVIEFGWANILEKRVIDEDKLELGELVEAWKEP